MRTDISGLNPSRLGTLEIVHIKYALLGCLRYTCQTEKLAQMLIYVLLCSNILAGYLHERLFVIIDCLVEIIGPEFDAEQQYGPAKVFGQLKPNMRWVLFEYMSEPNFPEAGGQEFILAKKQLIELLALHRPEQKLLFAEAAKYLREFSDYLDRRLSEIIMRILLVPITTNTTTEN